MNYYKDYVEVELQKLLPNNKVIVTNESNQSFDGGINDVVVVISKMGGSSDSDDIEVRPLNIVVWSCGNYDEINNDGENDYTSNDAVYSALETFVKANNGTSIELDDGTYIKQNLLMPMTLSTIDLDGASYRSSILISGALTINRNISDINKVFINGQKLSYLNLNIVYQTSVNSSRTRKDKLNEEMIDRATLSFSIVSYNRKDILGSIFKQIRIGEISPNTPFEMKLVYNDETTETYRVFIYDATGSNDKANPMSVSYTLHLAKEN